MAKRLSLKINIIINAIYQILILAVPLITTPFISRVLGPESVGQYSLYFSIVSFFSLFATFGFTEFGTKAISENRDNIKNKTVVFYSIFIAKLLLGIATLGIFFVYVFVSATSQNTIICYLSLGFYILASIIDCTFLFQGEERFLGICINNILIRIISLILIFCLIKDSSDLWIYCLILGLSQFLIAILTCVSHKKNTFCKINIKEINVLKYIRLAMPYFIPALSTSLFLYFNQILLGIMGISDLENGYYGQAIKIVQVLSTLAGSICIIMFSRISYLLKSKDFNTIKEKIGQTFSAFWIMAIPLFFGIYSVSDIFVPFFLGPGYDKVIVLIYILAPQIIFVPLNTLYGNLYYRPNNKIRIQTIIMFAASILNIILSLILIPSLESIGASISKSISEFIQLPFLVFYSRQFINTKNAFKNGVKPFFSAIIMALIVVLTKLLLVKCLNDIVLLFLLILEGVIIYMLFEIIFKDKLVINTILQVFSFIRRKICIKSRYK